MLIFSHPKPIILRRITRDVNKVMRLVSKQLPGQPNVTRELAILLNYGRIVVLYGLKNLESVSSISKSSQIVVFLTVLGQEVTVFLYLLKTNSYLYTGLDLEHPRAYLDLSLDSQIKYFLV